MKKKIFIWITTVLLICSTILTTVISSNTNIAKAEGGKQGENLTTSTKVQKNEVKKETQGKNTKATEKKVSDKADNTAKTNEKADNTVDLGVSAKGTTNIISEKRGETENIPDNIIKSLARNAAMHNDIITEMYITDNDGKPIPKDGVKMWETFKVNAKFALKDNKVHKGDTSTIKLPDELAFSTTIDFEVKDADGNLVANAVIDSATKTITLTYTDYPEKHSGVKGELFFYSRVDETKVKQEKDINLKFTISNDVTISAGTLHYKGPNKKVDTTVDKTGVQDAKDKSLFHYTVAVNRSATDLKNVVLKDRLGDDIYKVNVLKDTIKVYEVEWFWDTDKAYWNYRNQKDVTDTYKGKVTMDADQKGFSLELGNIGKKGYMVTYDIKADYTPADGEVFTNKAILKHSGTEKYEMKFDLRYLAAGGKAEGYVYSINLLKKDKNGGQALKGAEFQVTRDATGQVIGKFTTDDNGKISITKLLKDNYTIKETKAPNGYKLDPTEIKIGPNDFGSDKSITKEVLNEKDKTKICGTKTWDDNNNQDGKRPTKIKVKLLADGKEVASKEVTEQDGWKYSFDNLDKHNQDGTEIKYTIDEEVVEFYEKAIDGFNLTNKHVPEKTKVEGLKTWNDNNNQDGKRPTKIKVKLLADGKEVATKEVTEQDGWKYSFDNLDKYNKGKEIKYTIDEEVVAGYTKEINGYNLKNNYTPEIVNIAGAKTWDDNNNQDGKRPSKIKVKLLADGKEVASKEVTEQDGWKYSFDNLDKYKDGKEVNYTIDEEVVEFYEKAIDGFNLTNKHVPEKTKVEGLKTWIDNNNQDGKRPSKIKVKLLADGKEVATKEVTEQDGWKYSFDNLDKYKDGKEVNYTIDEEVVEFYEKAIDGFNLTNKHVPEKTKVEGLKTWDDNNNQDGKRPTKIKVKLLADGKEVATKEVTEQDGWKYSFDNLDKYKDGKEVNYTIDEEVVEF
ncbi:Cna B-type domain-containing protein, partial [Gemella bergeri]